MLSFRKEDYHKETASKLIGLPSPESGEGEGVGLEGRGGGGFERSTVGLEAASEGFWLCGQ